MLSMINILGQQVEVQSPDLAQIFQVSRPYSTSAILYEENCTSVKANFYPIEVLRRSSELRLYFGYKSADRRLPSISLQQSRATDGKNPASVRSKVIYTKYAVRHLEPNVEYKTGFSRFTLELVVEQNTDQSDTSQTKNTPPKTKLTVIEKFRNS